MPFPGLVFSNILNISGVIIYLPSIATLLGATELHTRETIDPSVLGGFRVEMSGKRLDATLKHKIDLLKEIDSRKGTV